jgi:hypothetical protein
MSLGFRRSSPLSACTWSALHKRITAEHPLMDARLRWWLELQSEATAMGDVRLSMRTMVLHALS